VARRKFHPADVPVIFTVGLPGTHTHAHAQKVVNALMQVGYRSAPTSDEAIGVLHTQIQEGARVDAHVNQLMRGKNEPSGESGSTPSGDE
jgi:hypothetical protein